MKEEPQITEAPLFLKTPNICFLSFFSCASSMNLKNAVIRTYLKIGSRFKAVIPESEARRESF